MTVENATSVSRAIEYLRDSRERLGAELAGIDDTIWSRKNAADEWTVAEVVEHLAVTERSSSRLFARLVADPVQEPARTSTEDLSAADGRLWTLLADNPTRREAPEFVRPKGRFATRAEAEAAFNEARDSMIDLAGNAPVDLRTRVADHPAFGTIDGVQWLIFLAAHVDRHLKQIQRIAGLKKAGP